MLRNEEQSDDHVVIDIDIDVEMENSVIVPMPERPAPEPISPLQKKLILAGSFIMAAPATFLGFLFNYSLGMRIPYPTIAYPVAIALGVGSTTSTPKLVESLADNIEAIIIHKKDKKKIVSVTPFALVSTVASISGGRFAYDYFSTYTNTIVGLILALETAFTRINLTTPGMKNWFASLQSWLERARDAKLRQREEIIYILDRLGNQKDKLSDEKLAHLIHYLEDEKNDPDSKVKYLIRCAAELGIEFRSLSPHSKETACNALASICGMIATSLYYRGAYNIVSYIGMPEILNIIFSIIIISPVAGLLCPTMQASLGEGREIKHHDDIKKEDIIAFLTSSLSTAPVIEIGLAGNVLGYGIYVPIVLAMLGFTSMNSKSTKTMAAVGYYTLFPSRQDKRKIPLKKLSFLIADVKKYIKSEECNIAILHKDCFASTKNLSNVTVEESQIPLRSLQP